MADTLRKLDTPAREYIVGSYRVYLNRKIGSGAFGNVYIGICIKTGKPVAVKEITHTFEKDVEEEYIEQMTRRLNDEIQCLTLGQGHQNIVKYLDVVTDDSSVWIIMEYCEDKDLLAYLKKLKAALPKELLMKFMIEASEAVDFLHAQTPPVVHRDIKVNNLLIQEEDDRPVLKLCDFGLVKLLPEGTDLRTFYMSTAAGTADFMAPEFFTQGILRYNKSVDIFSLGLVYQVLLNYDGKDDHIRPSSVEMLKKQLIIPFGQETAQATSDGKVLPKAFEHRPDDDELISQLKRLTERMLKPRAEDRLTATQVRDQLKVLELQYFDHWPCT